MVAAGDAGCARRRYNCPVPSPVTPGPVPPGPLPLVTEELLRALPKTDLHCHLDGSLRLETLLGAGRGAGGAPPGRHAGGALRRALHRGQPCQSLEDYLTAFDVTLSVLQTEEALYRVRLRARPRLRRRENVRYFEVRYSPVLHTRLGLKPTTIVDAVLDGPAAGEARGAG